MVDLVQLSTDAAGFALSSTMSENPYSVTVKEKAESHRKRDGDSEAPDLAKKKRKTDDTSSQEDPRPEVSNGSAKESQPRNQTSSLDDKRDDSEINFEIEANAAEDKGSRHTMEDAWVVLPDASLDSGGTLRFLYVMPFSIEREWKWKSLTIGYNDYFIPQTLFKHTQFLSIILALIFPRNP